ncbi:hypothetical protein Pst134EB_027368 [Puccinia striiformis f. sp. tritici]|nr:hypothetical protein Pst134EB_027368 [Puccinia striiformis f. sp. tritici]
MDDQEELFIPRQYPEDHVMPYQVPPMDLHDQTGMGFGGVDDLSDESSTRSSVGGHHFDWDQWNMNENFATSVNDHSVSLGSPGIGLNPDSEEGLNPNDNWYPFPSKEVCS